MFQELQIFCICMYVCIRMQVKFFWTLYNDFGVTAVDDITNGVTWAVFSFHIAHISFAIIIIIIIIKCHAPLLSWMKYLS
jgi:hypothetical protein